MLLHMLGLYWRVRCLNTWMVSGNTATYRSPTVLQWRVVSPNRYKENSRNSLIYIWFFYCSLIVRVYVVGWMLQVFEGGWGCKTELGLSGCHICTSIEEHRKLVDNMCQHIKGMQLLFIVYRQSEHMHCCGCSILFKQTHFNVCSCLCFCVHACFR